MTLPLYASSKVSPVSLMRLTQIKNPDELLSKYNKDDFIIEEKLDGWKVQAINNGNIHLYSRRGKEVTDNFPEIINALKFLPNNTLIEGELVYWNGKKQEVDKITSLANSGSEKSKELAKKFPGIVKFHIYDILWKNGIKVVDKPFSERRKLLTKLVKKSNKILITKEYPFLNWKKIIKIAVANGGEGIVIKLKSAPYRYSKLGSNEPKPANTMWKYKGDGGKIESDDYVVYGTNVGPKGKLKVLFGQYYKGKLYHISELSNFSAKNINEIKKRLKKGKFVIEIQFQERVPKGLRHQRFLRFRDDKNTKDATMHEFHIKNIDKLKEANLTKTASRIPTPEEFIKILRQLIYRRTKGKVQGQDFSGLTPAPNVDINKAYKLISHLESNNSYVVGDSGTSFGAVQVQLGSFLRGLSIDPNVYNITGLSSQDLKQLASAWSKAYKKMHALNYSFLKKVSVDEDEVRKVMKNRSRVVRRREGTTIRFDPNGQPGFVKIRNNKFIGYIIDLDKLQNVGLNIDQSVINELHKITRHYVTSAVVRNSIAKLFIRQQMKDTYDKFMTTFSRRRVQGNQRLRNLADRAVQRNFSARVRSVVNDVQKYNYDTTAPGAYNIYQLIAISNSSGVYRVRRFLRDRKLFAPGNLHYLQRANKHFNKEGISSMFPPNGGLGGFTNSRLASIKSFADDIDKNIIDSILDTMNTFINTQDTRDQKIQASPILKIEIFEKNNPPLMVVYFSRGFGLQKIIHLLPTIIRNLSIQYIEPKVEKVLKPQNGKKTLVDPISNLSMKILQRLNQIINEKKRLAKELKTEIPEEQIKYEAFNIVMREFHIPQESLEKMMGITVDEFASLALLNNILLKVAIYNESLLKFPDQYVEDIKSGKRKYTIRYNQNIPFGVGDIVQAITYSGAPFCKLNINSKEVMNLSRMEKAFGKQVVRSLKDKFGENERFTVISFDVHKENDADDTDKKKMKEILIDFDGKKITRGEIKNHYSKPSVEKLIMSRIKDKPVLIYIGVDRNKNILKRNHNDKEIIITNSDKSNSDKSDNYWYWVNRRVLSFHEVLGKKTKKGFVDLDLHGNFPLKKAKEYAKKYLLPALKKEFNSIPKIYESGGVGLHVEFDLKKEISVDLLRQQLKEVLDKINKNFDWVTTKIVKGNGLRSDISTLHNKGSLRVPGSLGELTGKLKRKISQNTDDNYGNSNFGQKHLYDNIETSGREGAFSLPQSMSVEPIDNGGWHAADDKLRWWESDGDAVSAFSQRKDLFRKIGDKNVVK